MSSADSGRYQSRLFNFFHQRSRRFTQQCDRAFRQIQFTTSDIATVVLYPLYLLFQSTRSATKQFYQASQGNWQLPADNTNSQPPTPPSVDTPIQRVLLLVNNLPLAVATPSPDQNQPSNPLAFLVWRFNLLLNSSSAITLKNKSQANFSSPSPFSSRKRAVIRGIATQLSSRGLVLVTAQNEIVDILTPEQQEKLQDQIIGEVAEFWQYQRLAHLRGQVTRLQLPTAQTNKSNKLKQSESGNRQGEFILPQSTTVAGTHPRQALVVLDRIVAEVESKHLAPVSAVAIALSQRSWELIQRIHQLGTSLSRGAPEITADRAESQTIRIQALISAAIDYFFGNRSKRQLKQTTSTDNFLHGNSPNLGGTDLITSLPSTKATKKRLSPRQQSVSANVEDPWLTLSDLFGDVAVSESVTQSQPTNVNEQKLFPANQSTGYSLRRVLGRLQKFFSPPTPAAEIVKQQKITTNKTREKVNSEIPLLVTSSGSAIASESEPFSSQSTQIKPAPDWIEINATTMGYVKHPLEQLLEWLDRAMLWLEEVLIRVWHWVQRSWHQQ